MRLTVVTGPPCGGKTTHVHEHARPGDIVVDLDVLALALTPRATPYGYPRHVTTVAVAARRAAIDTALTTPGAHGVWIIDSRPDSAALARYRQAGAHVIVCDPGEAVVLERIARLRPRWAAGAAAKWYEGQRPASEATRTRLDW